MSQSSEFTKLMDVVSKLDLDKDTYDMKIKTIDKFRMLSLFIDKDHQKILWNARGNYSRLKKDNLNYLMIETFTKLFISVCKLNACPLNEWEYNSKLSNGAFKRMCEHKLAEIDELEEELEKLKEKNLKGYIKEDIYDKYKEEKKLEIKEYQKQTERYKLKLEEQEKYYKEKLEKVTERHQKAQKHLSKHIQDKAAIDQAKDIVNYDSSDSTD